jgi:hypothetical protein
MTLSQLHTEIPYNGMRSIDIILIHEQKGCGHYLSLVFCQHRSLEKKNSYQQ